MRPLTVGDPVIIGRYLLLGRLGAGGMGVVYLAEHPKGGLVALKTPHAVHLSDPTLRARFAEEVAFSRRVAPFCTAGVIEDGTDRDRPYLVTEYIPGPALSQVIAARGPLTPDLAYGVALGAAAALVAVHEAGLVHRDLKPGNVLLSDTGPYVIDFGIARDLDVAAAHTQAGQVMGSPGWVAPERLMGGPALPPSDVFSWGCLVAFAATGHHPYGAGETDVIARRILVEEPRLATVPKLLWDPVAAALAKDPADRPEARELLLALLAAGGVGAPGDLREAVRRVLAEIWQPVPYPAEADPGAAEPPARRSPRTAGRTGGRADGPGEERPSRPSRRAGRRRGGHASHAGLTALATVSIAAVAVVAAGSGTAPLDEVFSTPEEMPFVLPHEETPGEEVKGTSYPRTGRGGPSVPAVAYAPGGRSPEVTVTATTTLEPAPGRTGSGAGDPWISTAPSPPSPSATSGPPPTADPPAGCRDRRGRPRPCPPTMVPIPSGSITQIPDWGDPEPPLPEPSPSPSGSVPDVTPSP